MGLGFSGVKLYLELYQRGFFKSIKSVFEMGSQELHLKQADFEHLVYAACVPNYKRENFTPWRWPEQPRLSSRLFYEMLGVEKYSCFDLNKELKAIPHDLNLPLEDVRLYGQYDLVTDHGCNEHAFNIGEAYRTMHRLCKQQGLMVIEQAVYGGNGYYMFDLSFFEGIAAANNYKVLFSSYVITTNTPTSAGGSSQFHIPASRELLDVVDWSKVRGIGIFYVLQKQSDSDFQYPYQGRYLSENQGHYGYQLQFLPDPPTRTYVPVYTPDPVYNPDTTDESTIPTKVLLRQLCVRLVRKIGLLGVAKSIVKAFKR